MLVVFVIGLGLAAAFAALLMKRQLTYFSYFPSGARSFQNVQFPNSTGEILPVWCDHDGFRFPEIEAEGHALFLELQLRSTLLGWVFDPIIRIAADGFGDFQVFERGLRGIRYVNLTRLREAGLSSGDFVKLQGLRLRWKVGYAKLHICREKLEAADRVLIVAPHPDDAEIAAFGLYSARPTTIVTITAGNATTRYSDSLDRASVPGKVVAKLRVLESITVGEIGNVAPESALNFCYPDGRLAEMHAQPARDFRFCENGLDFTQLREINRSSLVKSRTRCSWEDLVDDLAHVLDALKPTIIVTPHPWLDPHSDHKFSTLAVSDALRVTGINKGRFYFYANHNRFSELWPLGPSGAGVPVLPVGSRDPLECDSVYSRSLSSEDQMLKLVALESLSDIRKISGPEPIPLRRHLTSLKSLLGAMVYGLGTPPTSYMRRAVRPDEVFFTASFRRGCALCARVAESRAEQ